MAYAKKREDQLYTYDPNVDYQKKMNEAAASGDYESAARYEQQRNEKIKGEGMTQYQPTNQYAQYLPKSQGSYTPYDPTGSVAQAQQLLSNAMAQKPGAYESTWEGQMQDMLKQIMGRKPFEYDVNGDALYQQYKDQYMKLGQLAAEDATGQAAALTGGYGNSYANAVGHQAYQGYLDRLNDKVPELRQLALSEYQAEGQDMLDKYALMVAGDDRDYGRYQDEFSRYLTELGMAQDRYTDERNWQYQLGRDQVADDRYRQEWEYQMGRDQVADQRYQQEWEQSQANEQKNQAYELALSMLQSGMMPSDAVLNASGISREDAQKIYDKASIPAYSSGGGGGGGDKKDTGSTGKALTNDQWNELYELYQKGQKSGDLTAFYDKKDMLVYQGYDVSGFDSYGKDRFDGYDNDGEEDPPLPPTENDILALGFGPISEERLDELIRKGLVEEYIEKGRIRFRRVGNSSGSGTGIGGRMPHYN